MHTHCPITSCLLARSLRAVVDAPLVLTYHTKYDVDIAKAVRGKLLQESAIRALVQNVASCDEVWVVSRGAGENLRSLGYEGDYIVMENGVDVPRGRVSDEAIAAATGRAIDLPQNVPVFLFVGRLMWYKGIRMILDALRTLREKVSGLPHGVRRRGRATSADIAQLCGGAEALRPLLSSPAPICRPRDHPRVVRQGGPVSASRRRSTRTALSCARLRPAARRP